MLKIVLVKNFRVDKFSRFRFILEIFLRKMFYSRVKYLRLVSTVKLFNNEIFLIYGMSLKYRKDKLKFISFCIHVHVS